jgi:hypothetical protein
LSYFHCLRRLAPATVHQCNCSCYPRGGRALPLPHHANQRIDGGCRMASRQRSNICRCLSHLEAFRPPITLNSLSAKLLENGAAHPFGLRRKFFFSRALHCLAQGCRRSGLDQNTWPPDRIAFSILESPLIVPRCSYAVLSASVATVIRR